MSIQSRVGHLQSEIGMTRYHSKLFILIGIGWAFDNLFFQMLAIILPQLCIDFSLVGWRAGLPSFSMYVGSMLGNLAFGWSSDIYGRKPTFLLTLLLSSMATIALALSTSLTLVLLSTFLLGISVGGGLPIDGSLFLESIPPAKESLLALLSCFWPLGQVVAAVFAILIMPLHSCTVPDGCTDNYSWRYLCFILGVLSFFGFLLRSLGSVYESPLYLVSRDRNDEAFTILEAIAKQSDIVLDVTMQEFLDGDEENSHEDELLLPASADYSLYTALFKRSYISTTILMVLVWSFLGMGFNIFHGFLPDFLRRRGANATPRTITETYTAYMITSICGVPGSILAMVSSDSKFIGSKATLLASTLSTSICLVLFAVMVDDYGQLFASCLEAFSSNVMYGVLYYITPLAFPVELRGKGFGLCSAVSRLLGSFAPFIAGYLLEISFVIHLLVSAISLLVSFLLMFFISV